MKLLASLILVGTVIVASQTQVWAQTDTPPTPTPGKTFIPFGPVKTQLKINSKTGQKEVCETASSNRAELIKIEIKEKFGIDFVGGWSGPMLAMACNKLAEVSGTRFFDLLHYNKPYEQSIFPVTLGGGYDAYTSGQRNVVVGPNFGATENFIVVLMHEIGHVLFWATPNAEILISQARAADRGKPYANGSATQYGDYSSPPAPCTGSAAAAVNEDFAETVSYYLNPGINEQTPKNCRPNRIPFAEKNSGHYQFISDLLGDFE